MKAIIDEYLRLFTSPDNTRDFLIIAVNVLIFIVVFESLRMIKTISIGQYLASRSRPLSWLPAEPTGTAHQHILVVGDSTAVGTGSPSVEETLAGRLAHDFPNAHIQNTAVNGSLTRDVLTQLKAHHGKCFDLIIISTGGNDIWHLSSLKGIARDLDAVLTHAKQMSGNRVLLLLYNNIGDAPAFSFLIRDFLKKRGESVHEIFKKVSAQQRVPLIELFTEQADNPFLDPAQQKFLFARDGVHPSGEGYRYWYYRMWREIVQHGYNHQRKYSTSGECTY